MCSSPSLELQRPLPIPAVFIVDDEVGVCSTFTRLFQTISVETRCFHNPAEFLDCIKPEHHGCALLDLRLPGMSGLEVLQRLRKAGVFMPVIMLTGYGDVPTATQAMKAGAFDFFEKPCSEQILLESVCHAIQLDSEQRARREQARIAQRRLEQLSRREREVLDLIVAGKISKEIAATLGLSHKTVENHRARIMAKTRASGLAELVRMSCLIAAAWTV